MPDQIVGLADGRQISVLEQGVPRGDAVFLLHGTPGSRLGPRPRDMVLYQLGVRLIVFDRPGYGSSDRKSGRSVGDVAADVAAIADALGIGRFAVLGRSGGGPHALACAALLPDRVTRVAVLVGLAPSEAPGLNWFDGMTISNIRAHAVARAGPHAVAARLGPAAARIRANPAELVAALYDELTDSDRRVVADAGIRRMLISNYAEALRTSAHGWIDDVVAFAAPWGFDPADVEVPTLLWHGANDEFSPVGHARWLGSRIPHATVIVQSGYAHFGALDVMPDVLKWLITLAGARGPG